MQKEKLSVGELQELLGVGQSRISPHLAQLRRAGFVQDRRAGKNIYYALTPAASEAEFKTILEASARELPESGGDARALRLALNKRQDRVREYFNQLAGKFGRTYCPGRTWQGLSHLLLLFVPELTIA